jgi:glycosyltransferase involved in cell wall biosynthesis/O-antigen/teichoic acid export membrane protein
MRTQNTFFVLNKSTKKGECSLLKKIEQGLKANSTMLVNAGALIGTAAVTSALGFVYWWLAARWFLPETVGTASASVSLMMLLGTACMFGLGTLLITELPRQPDKVEPLISTALITVGIAGACVGFLFVCIAPYVSSAFQPLKASIGDMLIFAAGVSLTAISQVLDQALVGLLRGRQQLWRNTLFAVVKLAALVAVGLWLSDRGEMGIYATWVFSNFISLGVLVILAFPKKHWSVRNYLPQWKLLRKLGWRALEHHFLNLTVRAPSLLLPVLVTTFLSARMNAWFYVSWMIVSSVIMVSVSFTIVLHAMTSAQQSILGQKARLTICIGLAASLLANVVLQLGSKEALGLFGNRYAIEASASLRILILATLPIIITTHYVSICRVQDKIVKAMSGTLLGGLLELGLATLGAHLAGLLGLSLGWVIAVYIEAAFMFPTVYRVIRSVQHAPVQTDRESTQLRVCMVGSGKRFLSGISYYTLHLVNALAPSHKVSVILMRRLLPKAFYPGKQRVGTNLTQLEYDPGVRVFDGVDWYWLPSIFRSLAFLTRERPDVIVFQWWSGTVLHSYLLLALAARLLRSQVVIEFHEVLDTAEAKLPLAQSYVRLLAPLMLRLTHGFVVHSAYDRKILQSSYNLGKRPIALIPHGPYNHFQFIGGERKQRDASMACCNLLFFGVIRPFKGLEDLVMAFDALPESEISRYRLTIVGETWEGWTTPTELIKQSHYRDRITFVNRYVSDAEAAQFFADADVVVLPYHRSSMSGPLRIAMSYGLPIVVTKVGGLIEAVADYEGAILVPPKDPVALRHALQEVVKWQGQRFVDSYSWEQAATRYHALFDTLGLSDNPVGLKRMVSNFHNRETRLTNKNTLNILMVAARYIPYTGGLETHVHEVGSRLARNGVNVTLLTTVPSFLSSSLPKEEVAEGMHIIRVRSWPDNKDYNLAPEIYRVITNGQWDLIHCQGCHTFVPPLAMLAARKANIPYVVTFHTGGHSSRIRASIRRIQWQLLRPLLVHASMLIGVSHFEADYFRKLLHIPTRKLVVIPNGADLPKIPDQSKISGKTLIVSVGRLEKYKGHQHLITALPKIREMCSDAHLLVLGTGPYESSLRVLAQRVGVAEYVEFRSVPTSDRQRMSEFLSQATLVALLSDYESQGIAIIEALALRRPVLVANTSALREFAEQGLARAVSLQSTPEEIARVALEQIIDPLIPPTAFALPTWDECVDQLQTIYNTCIRIKELYIT